MVLGGAVVDDAALAVLENYPPLYHLIYLEFCEKHGVPQQASIQIAFSKAKHQRTVQSVCALEIFLDEITEADFSPLIEILPLVESSELDAVDIVCNSATPNGAILLKLIRSVGCKLRLVELKHSSFGKEALRDLFHRGIQCQILDLSNSRIRKLDMTGIFPRLTTLKLDFLSSTSLSEGCFRAMPNLTRLSMCGTRITNLWTACAALSKLPSLVELRFQSCGCCIDSTGQCATQVLNDKSHVSCDDAFSSMQPVNPWGINYELMYTPMSEDDLLSLDSEISVSSRSEEGDSEYLFSDDDLAVLQHEVDNLSGDSSVGSITEQNSEEQNGQALETMIAEEDANYHSDAEDERDIVSNFSQIEDVPAGPSHRNEEDLPAVSKMEAFSSVREQVLSEISNGECVDQGLIDGDNPFFQNSRQRDSYPNILETSDGVTVFSTPPKEDINKGNDSFEEGRYIANALAEVYQQNLQNVVGRPQAPACGTWPNICLEKYYREFVITRLPGLRVLDNLLITQVERDKAKSVFVEWFEMMPNNRNTKENIIEVLKRRERGSWIAEGFPGKRIGTFGHGQSNIGICKSLCALKMASCAWPSCIPICRIKKSNSELSRRFRPRQFEYHPIDPSLMVFGTLHGEVLVVNHESDKIVGHVQSMGASHSILGLCWFNKDPNKLIAGSDSGLLQLYDVERMRATTAVSYSQNRGSVTRIAQGSRQRSSILHTYDDFDQLTSVHINASDEYFLASGYSKNVGLYNLCTGKQVQIFHDLHQEHINVVKFAHHSPYIFATSSFDKDIKLWDLRQRVTKPLYTVRSTKGNVMVCFSWDDYYLLSSAIDNEVRQHLAVDGRLHTRFDIAPKNSIQNYTRSYYMNGRDYIITGSCEENVVRICCAQTGRRLRDLALEGHGSNNSIYVQSLRGDPFRDFHFCVLAAYLNPHSKSQILKVNLLASSTHRNTLDLEPQYWVPAGRGA